MKWGYVIGVMFLLLFTACAVDEKSGAYSEFEFQEQDPFEAQEQPTRTSPTKVAKATEPEPLETVPAPEPISNKEKLFTCKDDTDCILVQPDQCCTCPLAISKLFGGHLKTRNLDSRPKCAADYLCGVCAKASELTPLCMDEKCVALPTEEANEILGVVEEEPVQVEFFSKPELKADDNLNFIEVKPACTRNRNSVYMRYTLDVPTPSILEFKEVEEENYRELYTEEDELFSPEISIVICKSCIMNEFPVLRLDKVYHVRVRSDLDDGTVYHGDYTISTKENSEYMQRSC